MRRLSHKRDKNTSFSDESTIKYSFIPLNL